nr:MAG TPA: hypothetical protein [Caudoviricetes sp.]
MRGLSRTGKFGSIYFEEFPRKLFDISKGTSTFVQSNQ